MSWFLLWCIYFSILCLVLWTWGVSGRCPSIWEKKQTPGLHLQLDGCHHSPLSPGGTWRRGPRPHLTWIQQVCSPPHYLIYLCILAQRSSDTAAVPSSHTRPSVSVVWRPPDAQDKVLPRTREEGQSLSLKCPHTHRRPAPLQRRPNQRRGRGSCVLWQ